VIGFEALSRLLPGTDTVEITDWIERGWVRPELQGERWVFQEIDVARVQLIRDLRQSMALDDEAVPVVLSLMDQVYSLRSQLRTVLKVLENQPDELRRTVLTALDPAEPSPTSSRR